MKVLGLTFLLICGCASTEAWRMPYLDENNQADGAAYAGDAMIFRKNMPYRPNPKAWDFYFKHCSVNGNEAFYSKTSYDCAGPR